MATSSDETGRRRTATQREESGQPTGGLEASPHLHPTPITGNLLIVALAALLAFAVSVWLFYEGHAIGGGGAFLVAALVTRTFLFPMISAHRPHTPRN